MTRQGAILALLMTAGPALSWPEARYPRGMYCGGNQLVDMGGLRAARIDGTVEDPTGAPIPHARVQVQLQKSGKLVRDLEADDRGRFTLTHLHAGDYWLGISSYAFNLHLWRLQVVHGGRRISLRAELSLGT